MTQYTIESIRPSKYGEDRWRVSIGGEWYDAYLSCNEGELPQCPITTEVEWKQSQKTGKEYIVAIGDLRSAPPQRRQDAPSHRPATAPQASRPAAAVAPVAHPVPAVGTRDEWIVVSTIIGHWIDAHPAMQQGELAALAVEAATCARRVTRAFSSRTDEARVVMAKPSERVTVQVENPPDPKSEADQRGAVGPDFDDDVPF
jgi:hypothetical protein